MMIEINLLPPEQRQKHLKAEGGGHSGPPLYLLLIPLVFVILIIVHIFLAIAGVSKSVQLNSLRSTWKKLEPQKLSLDSFRQENSAANQDVQSVKQLLAQKVDWAEKLSRMCLDLPTGVWFSEFILKDKSFSLKASVVSLQNEEMAVVNKYLDNLKKDKIFIRDFVSLELGPSLKKRQIGSYEVFDFTISGVLK